MGLYEQIVGANKKKDEEKILGFADNIINSTKVDVNKRYETQKQVVDSISRDLQSALYKENQKNGLFTTPVIPTKKASDFINSAMYKKNPESKENDNEYNPYDVKENAEKFRKSLEATKDISDKLSAERNTLKYDKYLKTAEDVNNEKTTLWDKTGGVVVRGLADLGSSFTIEERKYKDENGNTVFLPSYNTLKQQKVSEDYNTKFGKILGDIGYNTTKILGSTALNAVTGGIGGSALYWQDMAVDNYTNAINQGYEGANAAAYSLVSTGLEYAVGKVLGGATSKLTGGSMRELDTALSNAMNKVIANPTLARIIGTGGSEFTEEFVQEYLDNINKLLILEENTNAKDYVSVLTNPEVLGDALYSGLVGFASGGLVEATNGSDVNRNIKMFQTFKEQLEQRKSLTTDIKTIEQYDGIIQTIDNYIKNPFSINTNAVEETQNNINNLPTIEEATESSSSRKALESLQEQNNANLQALLEQQKVLNDERENIINQEMVEETNSKINDLTKQVKELQKSSFNLDENSSQYNDLQKSQNIEFGKNANGDIKVTLKDANGNVINEFTLISEKQVIKSLGNDIGNYIINNANDKTQKININQNNQAPNQPTTFKEKQLDIINKTNPMLDDYHTGIRNIEDIKTFDEVINDEESFAWGDYTKEDALRDLEKGTITVYSSYPIENGTFVSTSYQQAYEYAGHDNSKVYSKTIPITDVAWINGDEGQYARVQPSMPAAKNFGKEIKLPISNVETRNAVSDNLKSYTSEEATSILRKENNVIVNNKQELADYVIEALNNPNSNKNLHLGIIPSETIQRIKNEIQNIKTENINTLFRDDINYALAVNQSEIRHMKKDSLTQQDIVNFIDSVDELIAQFDTVSYTLYNNQNALRFKKAMNDGTHIALEVISNKNHTLRTHTLFLDQVDFENKKRTLSPTLDELNNSPSKTSKMDGLSVLSNENGITNNQKSQIAPLPSQYNMQQNRNNIPTKQTSKANTKVSEVKLPTKEIKTNKTSIPMAKKDDVIKVASQKIAKQINSTGGFDLKQRSWVGTSTESEILKNKVYIDDLDVKKINYVVQSNKKSLDNANNRLKNNGYEKTLDYVKSIMQSDKLPSASDVALMQRMIQEASKKGDAETVQDLIMNTAIIGTDLGQATQALSIIQRLTPEGQLKMYTKLVQRAKSRGEKSFQNVEITPEMVQNVLEAYKKDGTYDQDDLNNRVEKFKQSIANQMKTTAGEKIDAWRYLSMLGNPKTHIRNMVSNVAMRGTIKVKNAMARTLETILPVKDRTKTWKKASNEVQNFAEQTANEMKGIITGENKYNEKSSIESKKQIFKNKALEKLSNFNSNALEAEDWFFSKKAFKDTLQEYLTAKGINTKVDIENNSELVEKAKLYAVEQAEIATFRQYSKLASMIGQFQRKSKFGRIAVEALMPFKKTPVNVAKAGVSYSPIGLLKNISYDVYQLKQGNINASQFIDNLAQGLTGTSLTLLGYALAKSGVLSGSGGDDKDDKYDKQLGKTGYSLNIGGNSYSISWLSPVAMPLLVGSNAYEQLEEDKEWDMNVVSDTLAKTLDPLNEMSFMQGLTNALQSYGSGADKIKGSLESTAQNYVGQFFPTLFSQLAATTDDKKRSTKASNNSSYKFGEQTIRSIMYKVPGLRQQLEVATDIWGNEKEQSENILQRAFESFIAPYSKNKDISTNLDKEIKRVYNETGESGVIPNIPYAYTKYDGETYKMSAKEYTDFKKTYGQTANSTLNKLINSADYKEATDEDKAKMIDSVYDYARAKANEEYFDNSDTNYENKMIDKLDTLKSNYGISADTYFANKKEYDYAYQNPDKYSVIRQIAKYDKYTTYKNEITDIRNNTSNDKIETIKYINSLNMNIPQKAMFIKQYYKSFKQYDSQIIQYINNQKLTSKEKEQILTQLGFTIKDGRVYY